MKKYYQGQRLEINKAELKKHNFRMFILEESLKRGFYKIMKLCGMKYMIKKQKCRKM